MNYYDDVSPTRDVKPTVCYRDITPTVLYRNDNQTIVEQPREPLGLMERMAALEARMIALENSLNRLMSMIAGSRA